MVEEGWGEHSLKSVNAAQSAHEPAKSSGAKNKSPILCLTARLRGAGRGFLEIDIGQPPILAIEDHGRVQAAHLGAPLEDLFVIDDRNSIGGDPLEQLWLAFRSPAGPAAVFDVIDPHGLGEPFFAS